MENSDSRKAKIVLDWYRNRALLNEFVWILLKVYEEIALDIDFRRTKQIIHPLIYSLILLHSDQLFSNSRRLC